MQADLLPVSGDELWVQLMSEPPLGRATGKGSLSRQALSLGGGSTEMEHNLISERVLGMPREHAADRDVAYRDMPHARRT